MGWCSAYHSTGPAETVRGDGLLLPSAQSTRSGPARCRPARSGACVYVLVSFHD